MNAWTLLSILLVTILLGFLVKDMQGNKSFLLGGGGGGGGLYGGTEPFSEVTAQNQTTLSQSESLSPAETTAVTSTPSSVPDAQSLLPNDESNAFSDINPSMSMNIGHQFDSFQNGVTFNQSTPPNRNGATGAYWLVCGAADIPKKVVSPWNNSTIEEDNSFFSKNCLNQSS